MPHRSTGSIQRKVTSVILTASFVSIVLTCTCFVGYEFFTYPGRIATALSSEAEIIGANSTAALTFDNRDDAQEILAALSLRPTILSAAIYGKEGALFAEFTRRAGSKAVPGKVGIDGVQFLADRMTLFLPITLQGKRIGTIFIESDYEAIYSRIETYGVIALLVMLVSLTFAYVFASRIQSRISKPILSLAETARDISEKHDYTIRAATESDDEIGQLAEAFNDMLEQIRSLNAELEQRVIQRTAQLEAANKELEAFSYSVSHDLRAPLRHIDGFTELLLKKSQSIGDPAITRYAGIISDSARKMGDLIDELLEFSRMGRKEMQEQMINLDALVAEVVTEAKTGALERDIAWNISRLPRVAGDYAMLKLVFQNLISNAVKYSSKVDRPKIDIGCSTVDGTITCFVRDNGAGFDMNHVGKLFGVFQRLHRSEEYEGIGIGLANVRRIVVRHGGLTWAEGKLGEGATFYFSLPQSNRQKSSA